MITKLFLQWHLNPESNTSNLVPREDVQTEVMENEPAVVKLVVMDGIVMGPWHCAFHNCTRDLANSQGAVFCSVHDIQYGAKCRVNGCLKSDWNTSIVISTKQNGHNMNSIISQPYTLV